MQDKDKSNLLSLKRQALDLMRNNRLAQAKPLFEHICDSNETDADSWSMLSTIYGKLGSFDEAEKCCRRVIALQPEHPYAHLNLGNVYHHQGNLDGAETEYRHALRLNPNDAAAHNNLGNILYTLGRIAEATEHFQESIRLDPNSAEAHSNLGNIYLYFQGKLNEAAACHQEALRLKPDFVEGHINLGNVYTMQGRLNEAQACYQEALRYDPHNALAHSNLLFMMTYRADCDPETIFKEHERWGNIHGRDPASIAPHANKPDPNKRLRIGYVSADFRNHPVGIFIEQVLKYHNPSHFEIFCYSNHVINDDLTSRLRGYAHHWRDVLGKPDKALAEQIRRDGIDILVDLAGHTAGNRLTTFALKPAPIQITWMSYIATTGLKAIDYIIGNRYIIPPEEEQHYVEKIIRLPHSFLCFSPPQVSIEVSPPPALTNGRITFGCFNNTAKLTPAVIATWSKLLRALPNAQLFLKSNGFKEQNIISHFQAMFAEHGVQADRIRFAGRSPRLEYLTAYHLVDIALDPFPYNGGTTTVEALWMGVPLVTLRGNRFSGHMGESILMNIGLEEYVADSEEDYLAKAVALASDLPRLTTLRLGLRRKLLDSPLCDGPGFTRDLEAAYRRAWISWCQHHTQSA